MSQETAVQTSNSGNGEQTRTTPTFQPQVDIIELPEELLIRADLPGAAVDDVDVNFEEGRLTIHARVHQRQADETKFLLREYAVGDYRRTFEVSEAIDLEGISAHSRDGVLTLHLPKSQAARPRRIEVKSE